MGLIKQDEEVVCIATGHGLKDPDIVLKQFPKPIEAEASIETIAKLILNS